MQSHDFQISGVLESRFGTGQIVVTAPSKIKAGRELQLPSMVLLTNKASSQQFFLRILKVIIQLRDAARTAAKKQKRTGWYGVYHQIFYPFNLLDDPLGLVASTNGHLGKHPTTMK